jgi:hypothetical protein
VDRILAEQARAGFHQPVKTGVPRKRRRWRWMRRGLLAIAAIGVVGLIAFLFAASRAQRDFQPINEARSAEREAEIDRTEHYRRPEEATYLSYPEWYLVSNPQEYAEFLHHHRPSGFPYGRSIGQFWSSYAQVYAIARHYPFNAGEHLMLAVIGTSSTIEWLIKGAYENTIGRLFELRGGERTAEENYAAEVARDYGNFIPTQPWFDFPFGEKFQKLWTTTAFFERHFPRKCERKFFLSLEYGVKTIYAGLIRLASHSVYGVADTEVFAMVTHLPAQITSPEVRLVRQLPDGLAIVTLPHYQGFTDTAPILARDGGDFVEVAGNDEMLVTLIAPAGWNYDLAAGKPLFTMGLLSGPELKRVAIQAPIRSLGAMLREIEAKNLRVEHLFDY